MAGFRAIGSELWAARAALDLVRLVGGDHPAGREAAAEARAIFERVAARPYLDLLDAAVAGSLTDRRLAVTHDAAASRAAPG